MPAATAARPHRGRALIGAAIASLIAGVCAPATSWGAAPTAPASVTLTALASPSIGARARLTWPAATDSDADSLTYVVQQRRAGQSTWATADTTSARALTLNALQRGTTTWLRVIAVDSTGQASHPSPATHIAPPPLSRTLTVSLMATRRRSCGARCTVGSLAATSLRGRILPTVGSSGRRITVEMAWRRPGTKRYRPAGRIRARLSAAGTASAPLNATAIRFYPGSWCMRASIAATSQLAAATSNWRCLRYRPPVTVGWAGDIVLGSQWGMPPANSMHVFDGVLPLLRSPDLMIGNYEGTLSTGGRRRCSGGDGCFIFQAPPRRADALVNAGFDVMNLANNHTLDKGAGARSQGIRALARRGIAVAGAPSGGGITVQQVGDIRVAVLGYSAYSGTPSIQPAAVRRQVARARRRADVVVATFHAGREGASGALLPRGSDAGAPTRSAAHAAVNAGADVVFGSGPHVVRGVERYRSKLIFYSTGNFMGWHNFALTSLTSQSGVIDVTLDHRGRTRSARWNPVVMVGPGLPVRDRSGRVIRRVRSLTKRNFPRRARASISRSGTIH